MKSKHEKLLWLAMLIIGTVLLIAAMVYRHKADAKPKAVQTYQVVVDYDQTLDQMVKAGGYDMVVEEEKITAKNFPFQAKGKVNVDLQLIHFGKAMQEWEIDTKLDRMGLRPATIEELLAFGAQYRDEQRKFAIVAMGSQWVDDSTDILVFYPFLGHFRDSRFLQLYAMWKYCNNDANNTWVKEIRFLVAPKNKRRGS